LAPLKNLPPLRKLEPVQQQSLSPPKRPSSGKKVKKKEPKSILKQARSEKPTKTLHFDDENDEEDDGKMRLILDATDELEKLKGDLEFVSDNWAKKS